MAPALKTPLEIAMKLLSIRPHSEFELIQKLKKKNLSAPQITECLNDCRRYGFVNDDLFARDYAQILLCRGCGRRLIAQKLRMHRLSNEVLQSALNSLEGEQSEAKRALEYKLRLLKNETDPQKKQQKLYRFLLGRGFDYSTIKSLLQDDCGGEEEPFFPHG